MRKDHKLAPGLTVLIPDHVPTIHLDSAKGVDKSRVVPAVLDHSFCVGTDCALRINLILTEGTTPAQREAAIDVLSRDRRSFPRDS